MPRTTQLASHSPGHTARSESPWRALTYERVSRDLTGIARSPEEQHAVNLSTVTGNGWTFVARERDNDRGASVWSKKERAGFDRLLERVRAGEADVVVVWEMSRLTRDLALFVTEVEPTLRATGTRLCVGGTTFDFDDPTHQMMCRQLVTMADHEAGMTHKRTSRASKAGALAGAAPGGRVLYGYMRTYDPTTGKPGLAPDPMTAPIVVELFERIAAGETLVTIARDLNRRGIPAGPINSEGWTGSRISSRVGGCYSYLGHRTHNGEVVAENAWPALVDVELFELVQSILRDPTRRASQDIRTKHLLSGPMVCGVCGGRLSAALNKGNPRYFCAAVDCGATARKLDRLDYAVSKVVVDRLSRPDALNAFVGKERSQALAEVESQLARHRRLLERAEADYQAEMIEASDLKAARDSHRPAIAELESQARGLRADVPVELRGLAGSKKVSATWRAMPVGGRRVVLSALFDKLELLPSQLSGGHRWRKEVGVRFTPRDGKPYTLEFLDDDPDCP